MAADLNWNDFEIADIGKDSSSPEFNWDDFEVAEFGGNTQRPSLSRHSGGLAQLASGTAEEREFAPESMLGILEGAEKSAKEFTNPLLSFLSSFAPKPPSPISEASKIREEGKSRGELLFDLGLIGGEQAIARGATKKLPKLLPKASEEELVSQLTKRGFTPEQITPLLQSPNKARKLGKIASNSEKIIDRLKSTRNKIGDVADKIRTIGKDLPGLSGNRLKAFESSFNRVSKDIPRRLRRMLDPDIKDLLQSEKKASDLYDFYRAIGKVTNDAKDRKVLLNAFKDPILKGMKLINPSLEKEFTFSNKLFSDLYGVSKQITPNRVRDIFDVGEILGMSKGIVEGNPSLIKKVLGASGARALSRELLINPRFQNISKRLKEAIKNGNSKAVQTLTSQIISDLVEENPEIIEEWEF